MATAKHNGLTGAKTLTQSHAKDPNDRDLFESIARRLIAEDMADVLVEILLALTEQAVGAFAAMIHAQHGIEPTGAQASAAIGVLYDQLLAETDRDEGLSG